MKSWQDKKTIFGKSTESRFWEKVQKIDDDSCWEWQAAIGSTGRGIFVFDGKNIDAHRMAWKLSNGEIPFGLFVLHHCDNGKCVNPKHLFLGTSQDNVNDMIKKGRKVILRGENDPKSKLTEQNVRDIKRLYIPYNKEFNQAKLADMFGVSRSTILAILRGDNWKHVK